MNIKYLSSSGLTEVWSNIKTYIASKIPSKIITGLSIKGKVITYTNSDGTTGTLTTQDTNTDTRVTQTVTTTNAEYPVLFSTDANKTATSTTTARFSSNIKINPSTNTVTATTFKGNLSGTATKATQDSDGKQINTTYSKVGHNHDDRYYTESEIDTKLNSKVNTSYLSTVATSGSYNDLTNKPIIPTVNNATLTIQKNGTTVKTFTANSSANVTANITVPTKVSDLTNDSGFLTSTAISFSVKFES